MIKKITAIALSVLLLTACHAEERKQQVTGTTPTETTVTTPLTLTEIITEEVFPEPEDNGIIELAVYNPFTDCVKVDDSTREELTEAMKKILDGMAFYGAHVNTGQFYIGSEYEDNFADTDIVMETEPRNGFVYSPLNPEIAETEEELIEYFRSVFTEKWIGENYEENLREIIFNEGLRDYKTIDGTLCVLVSPDSALKRDDLEKMIILDYDGTTAKIAMESTAYNTGATANVRFFSNWTITKCEEYGWRLDSTGSFYYYELRMNLLHTLLLNCNKINDVLSGKTDKSVTAVIDGEEYYLSEADMSIKEMTEFFTDIFHTKSLAEENNYGRGTNTELLRDEYIEKYINAVYAESDGALYRKASAPEWYLPEIKIRPDVSIIKRDNLSAFTVPIVIDGESHPITVKYGIEVGGAKPLCFASGLPIKTLE
ncbi:MAG: hypothetical protein IJZ61_00980 [Oscillospiraceae bacterium]|nr:hypothetical protein [Oscillospiraceae bacterium]